MMQKDIQVGPAKLSLTQDQGKVLVAIEVQGSLGGGSVEGAVQAKASASVAVDELVLVEAGLEVLEKKFPQLASLVEGAKAAIEAELKKV